MITLPSGRKIGEGEYPFIVAEVGSNWSSLEDCKLSIRVAKACGADAVKFQLFDHHSLYGSGNGFSTAATPMIGVLNKEWLPILKSHADQQSIEFMCSAFSPELIDVVDPYVNIHKVASAEMTHVRMLEKLQQIGKPVFLSTGASGEADIHRSLECLNGTPVIPMYCVAAYPANEIDLDIIQIMKKTLKNEIGFSDHSTDVLTIPTLACTWKSVVVLEKHVNFCDSTGPDSTHALNFEQFKRMVASIRGRHESRLGPNPEENPMVIRHNRRLIATRDIQAGEVFKENENFGIYRSLKDDAKGLSPFAIDHVNGKIAKNSIQTGDGIGPNDV